VRIITVPNRNVPNLTSDLHIPRAFVPKASTLFPTPVFIPPQPYSNRLIKIFPADVIFLKHAINGATTAMSLPTSRRFITRLFNSLSSISTDAEAGVNPLSAVPETAKKQLLSLQVLFPNEFLPALDLLDRKLVTRLIVDDGDEEDANKEKNAAVIEVQSEDKTMTDPTEPSVPQPSSPHAHLLDDDHVMSDVPAHETTLQI
jgi:hypothetical protein